MEFPSEPAEDATQEDPLWARLRSLGFSRTDQVKGELKGPQYLADLFDTAGECIDFVKDLHGFDHKLHEVAADADALFKWKDINERELEILYRMDRLRAKRFCLRLPEPIDASEAYSVMVGMDIKLQCNVSRATFRGKLADPNASKQELENVARLYWLKVMVAFLVEAQLPVCEIADKTSDPQAILERSFGSRRLRTLRSRARAWRKVASWMTIFKGYSFPQHVPDMLDYLLFLQQEGVSKGQVDGVAASLSVLEDAGQVSEGSRISSHRLWIQALKACISELEQGAKPVRKAPPLSVAMVLALEEFVVEEENPLYARAIAWVTLVCVWACMRVSDLEGLAPGRITVNHRGLRGFLTRTKTTGPGKQVREVPVFIARNVSLSGADWLKVGWKLWSDLGQSSRDYFVFVSKPDMSEPVMKYASVEKVASYMRYVMAMLRKPSKKR